MRLNVVNILCMVVCDKKKRKKWTTLSNHLTPTLKLMAGRPAPMVGGRVGWVGWFVVGASAHHGTSSPLNWVLKYRVA